MSEQPMVEGAQKISRIRKLASEGLQKTMQLKDFISLIISISALIVSVLFAVLNRDVSIDTVDAGMIRGVYDIFMDLNGMSVSNPEIAHIFELPENYTKTESMLLNFYKDKTDPEIVLCRNKERGTALRIFTMFEHSLYQYQQAMATKRFTRAEFLRQVLDYFTDRLLRNPRLLWLWDAKGGNLMTHFEKPTRDYYSEHVKLEATPPNIDPVGPFPK